MIDWILKTIGTRALAVALVIAVAVAGTMAAGLGIQTWRIGGLHEQLGAAKADLRTAHEDTKTAADAADANLGAYEKAKAALAECTGDKDEIEESSARARREDQLNLQAAAKRVAWLEAERARSYAQDPEYRAWADRRAPRAVFDRLRRAAADGGPGATGRAAGPEVDPGPEGPHDPPAASEHP